MDDYEETHVIEELDGQKIVAAVLVHTPEGDQLVLTLEGDQQAIIKPCQGSDGNHLEFSFPEPPDGLPTLLN